MVKISSQNRAHDSKKYFPQTLLIYLKTYLNSSLNTKYEGLTRKTQRDILKKRSEISGFSLDLLTYLLLTISKVNKGNQWKSSILQIVFSSYLARFFELALHIWCSGSYLNMFSGKLNIFTKKYFFTPWARFWIRFLVILRWNLLGISSKSDQNLIKIQGIFIEKIFFHKNYYFFWKHTQ